MLTIDERLLRAIAALKTRPEGQLFFDWLARSGDTVFDSLADISDERQLRQAQGQAQLLRFINDAVANAETLAKKGR